MSQSGFSLPDVRSVEALSSLDSATKIVRSGRAYWRLAVYPTAGEAGGSVRFASGSGREAGEFEVEEDRAAAEAARRARAKIRRYGVANGLNRLGTLTYRGEGCFEPVAFRSHIGLFFRKLKDEVGASFPYVWVPEWHPGGHGLHAHFAVSRYVKRQSIEDAWGRGFVHIKLLGHLPVGSGRFAEARRAGRYLAKYIGKDFDAERVGGLHRYDVARGYEPAMVQVVGRSVHEVLNQASEIMGAAPSELWHSDSDAAWRAAGGVGVMVRLSETAMQEAAAAWAESTCTDQGVAVKVTDAQTVEQVAALLATSVEEARASKSA